MKHTLVTGGCGFIGSHLVDRLIELGNKVVVLDDLSTGSEKNLNSEATFYQGDVNDRKLVIKILSSLFKTSLILLSFALIG